MKIYNILGVTFNQRKFKLWLKADGLDLIGIGILVISWYLIVKY